MKLYVQQLTAADDVSSFCCGDEAWEQSVADYLREDAVREQALGHNKTHLFFSDKRCVAYVSITASQITTKDYDGVPEIGRKSAPCLTIAKLAVVRGQQGQGHGRQILDWVLTEADRSNIGFRFLWVDVEVENRRGMDFYERYGFTRTFRPKRKKQPTHLQFWYDIYGEVA